MFRRLILLPAFLLFLAPWRQVLAAAEPGHDFARWEKDIAALEERDRANPPPKEALLFIGSSVIANWESLAADFPNYQVINRAFENLQVVDITHFADRLIFPHEPRAIFIRAGGNDLHAGRSPAEVLADFQDFVATVRTRLPAAEIYFISLGAAIARLNEGKAGKELNALVEKYARHDPRLHYIDTWSVTLDAEGKPRPELFGDDRIHFNAEGYKLLAARIRPHLPPERIVLWNGIDLTGWKVFLDDATVEAGTIWSAIGGVLRLETKAKGYVRTERSYSNYQLHVEWRWSKKTAAGNNSGVFLHLNGPDAVWPACYECEMRSGNTGQFIGVGLDIPGAHLINKRKRLPRLANSSEKPPGEWNQFEIYARGNTVEVFVNGVRQNFAAELPVNSGCIALQLESCPVEFRKVWLQRL